MNATRITLLLIVTCLTLCAGAERTYFRDDLLFYASFDQSLDADFARGAKRVVAYKGEGVVEGKYGRALHFVPEDGVRFCEYEADGNIRPDAGTIAFYFKPDWPGDEYKIRYLFFCPGPKNKGGGANFPDSIGIQTMRYRKPEQEIWLWYDDHGGGNNIVRGKIHTWRKGRWYHVAVTWDSEWLHVYIDGVLRGRFKLRGKISEPGSRFYVGSSRNGGMSSEGVLDEFYIYGRALSLAEIGLLTGKPEFIWPRIHSLTLLQSLFFRSERRVPFRCELTGRIDREKHRLRALVLRDGVGKPMASAEFPGGTGRHAMELPRVLPEGRYRFRVALIDRQGEELDAKSAPLHIVAGPFDTTTP